MVNDSERRARERYAQQQREREMRARHERGTPSISFENVSSPMPTLSSHHFENESRQRPTQNKKNHAMYNEAMKELKSLEGMDNVISTIEESLALATTFKAREKYNLKNESHALHMIFKGNAGTGKTTVARLVGKLFVGAGLLKKGDFKKTKTDRERVHGFDTDERNKSGVPFVEVTNADISSAFWGEDEKNMKKKFDEANGGVLFIDEAYSMISRSGHRSGEKVSAVLVAEMENRRDSVCVIGAGYPAEMEEFVQYNTGLASRFATVVNFNNYPVSTLLKIANQMAKDRDYKLSEDYIIKLGERLEKERLLVTFGNARTVRNIIEQSIRKQAKRVYDKYGSSPSREHLINLEGTDCEEFTMVYSGAEYKDPFKQLYEQALKNGIVNGEKGKLPKSPKAL